jgi:hypothetical protein
MRPCTSEQPTAMIRFTCHRCGYRIKSPQGTAGRQGRCPKCHHTVCVPGVCENNLAVGWQRQAQSSELADGAARSRSHRQAAACRCHPARRPETCTDIVLSRETERDRAIAAVEEGQRLLRPEQLDRMGKIAAYLAGRRGLVGSIVGALLFGLIGIGVGAASLEENPLNVLLIGIGGLLLLDAFVLSVTRNPAALLLDGIATCTVGVWNIVVGCSAYAPGSPDTGTHFWALLGISQCVWGGRIFASYCAAAEGARWVHDKALVEEVQQAIRTLGKTYLRVPADMIQVSGNDQPWQARLMSPYAVFATARCTDFIFVARGEVALRDLGKSRWSSQRKVDIRLRDRVLHGTMSSECLDRLAQWKGTSDPAHTLHHLPTVRVPVGACKAVVARDVSVCDVYRVPRRAIASQSQRRPDGARSSKARTQPLGQGIRRMP